jgi:hypothetical protein
MRPIVKFLLAVSNKKGLQWELSEGAPASATLGRQQEGQSAPLVCANPPIAITEARGKQMKFPRPKRVAVKYGEPMMFAELSAEAKTCSKVRLKEIYQQVADEIMAAIAKLEPHEDKIS